jgi:predicted Zn-dependent protease with MMP-like domain
MAIHVSRARFEELVADALDAIPDELAMAIENVAVIVEDHPTPEQAAEHGDDLLGLYEGVALVDRGFFDAPALPDRILLFRHALCEYAEDEDDLVEQVLVTVVHEIAHHFGIDDDRLEELGWA